MKLDILAIGVHPDDIELSCSGTLLSHIDQGKVVGLCDLTQGELGTRGSAALRLIEAENARRLMGAVCRENLAMADGFFEYSKENILKIVEVIRFYQPEIVIANALSDRHPDHGRAAKLVSDACFSAGLRKVETYREGISQEAWRPKVVYHYIQDNHIEPDFVVDITGFFIKKMELIRAFSSQFYDPESKEPDSPISGKDFMDFMESKARLFGRPAGFEHAEGFNVGRYIGVRDLFDLS
jgi:bacillithiol biosynthesis deacetylase BshB1